jgi:DNA-binding transcriptional ArsR family regulator
LIVFNLPADAVERLAFAYSPLLEAVLSLHVLVEPKHHPVQHAWVRQMQRLSPALKKKIATFGFAYRSYFPAFLFPPTTGFMPTFESELKRLETLTPKVITFEFTEAACPGFFSYNLGRVDDAQAMEAILSRFAEQEPDQQSQELLKLAVSDPERLLSQFVQLLGEYWEAAFRQEWERIEETLARNVTAAGNKIAFHGLYDFLQSLWPEVRTDKEGEKFWIERVHDHQVQLGITAQLLLVPSIYVWPHLRVNCDPPWPLCLVFPVEDIKRDTNPILPDRDMLRVLKALSDDVRLQALRLIVEKPRSTQELAPLLGLSETALSKHLRLLAEAGILQPQRSGYYVLYHLVPEQINALIKGINLYLEK